MTTQVAISWYNSRLKITWLEKTDLLGGRHREKKKMEQRNVIEASKYLTLNNCFPIFNDNVNSGDGVTTKDAHSLSECGRESINKTREVGVWERDGDVGKRREKSRKVQKFKVVPQPPTPTHASERNTQKYSSSPSIHPPRSAVFLFCLSKETSFVITRNAPQFCQLLRSSTKRKLFWRKSQFRHVVLAIITHSRNLHPIQSQSIGIKVDYKFMRRNFVQPPHVLSVFLFPSSLTSPFAAYLLPKKKSLTDWR